MKYLKILSIVFFIGLLVTGCEDRKELTAPEPMKPVQGSVDFTRFVAIGNSLTAGLESGSLYESAQRLSFPAQIARMLNTEFALPLISSPGLPSGRIEVTSLSPSPVFYYNPGSGAPLNLTHPKPYNNLAVPGAFLYDILNAKDSTTCFSYINGNVSNPLFNVILRGQGTIFQQARALQPTFITLWIGNNDILYYSINGATGAFTPVVNFQVLYNQLLDSVKSLNAKVAVANIPDVTSIPYFNTVGPSLFLAGTKVIIAENSSGTPTPMSTLTNYITLPAQALLAQGYGTPTKPLPNKYVLDSTEAITVKNIINQYNDIIKNGANAKDFALVDINKAFTSYVTGVTVNGIRFNTRYIEGNLMSLDGIHPTGRGQGLIANEFIKAINAKYGSNIPLINVSLIPGTLILR